MSSTASGVFRSSMVGDSSRLIDSKLERRRPSRSPSPTIVVSSPLDVDASRDAWCSSKVVPAATIPCERSLQIVRHGAQQRTTHPLGLGIELRSARRIGQLHTFDGGCELSRARRKQEPCFGISIEDRGDLEPDYRERLANAEHRYPQRKAPRLGTGGEVACSPMHARQGRGLHARQGRWRNPALRCHLVAGSPLRLRKGDEGDDPSPKPSASGRRSPKSLTFSSKRLGRPRRSPATFS